MTAETITVTARHSALYDSDGNAIAGDDAIELATIAIAPGNTTLAAVNGGDTDTADFTVYLALGSPIADDDEVIVRNRVCRARVKQWISPRSGRGGLEVVCTSTTGTSGRRVDDRDHA